MFYSASLFPPSLETSADKLGGGLGATSLGCNQMNIYFIKYFITLVIILFLYSCNDNSTNSTTEKQNLSIDSSYSIPVGGDPRGNYIPNIPFVFYFGNENSSFVQNSGEGWLKVEGNTATSGDITYDLITKVGGMVGNTTYAVITVNEKVSGIWKVENKNFIVTINNISDTIAFSSKNQALFLIYNRFKSKPFDLIDPDPGVLGSTVWVFK